MERLEFTLGDAQPVAMLTHVGQRGRLAEPDAPVLLVDDATLAAKRTGDIGAADPEAPGLRDLHLRLDRPAQGRAW